MAKHDTYDIKLSCPMCGRTGTAVVREEENPVEHPCPNRQPQVIPDGFEWHGSRGWSEPPDIRCAKCGEAATSN